MQFIQSVSKYSTIITCGQNNFSTNLFFTKKGEQSKTWEFCRLWDPQSRGLQRISGCEHWSPLPSPGESPQQEPLTRAAEVAAAASSVCTERELPGSWRWGGGAGTSPGLGLCPGSLTGMPPHLPAEHPGPGTAPLHPWAAKGPARTWNKHQDTQINGGMSKQTESWALPVAAGHTSKGFLGCVLAEMHWSSPCVKGRICTETLLWEVGYIP